MYDVVNMGVYLAHIETESCKKLKCHLALRARWQINMNKQALCADILLLGGCTKKNVYPVLLKDFRLALNLFATEPEGRGGILVFYMVQFLCGLGTHSYRLHKV